MRDEGVDDRDSGIANREPRTRQGCPFTVYRSPFTGFDLAPCRLIILILAFALAPGAWAKEAAPAAEDPVLERRVMALSQELRCLVCQNQTIADSNADLAVDLRNQVREKIRQGASDQDIIDFMVARYGDFILYRPPFKAATLLLWLGPLLLLAAGLAALYLRVWRRRAAAEGIEITEADHRRAEQMLTQEHRERE
jgi:cytochrome c-type biogenesis protein CcmH